MAWGPHVWVVAGPVSSISFHVVKFVVVIQCHQAPLAACVSVCQARMCASLALPGCGYAHVTGMPAALLLYPNSPILVMESLQNAVLHDGGADPRLLLASSLGLKPETCHSTSMSQGTVCQQTEHPANSSVQGRHAAGHLSLLQLSAFFA